MDVVFPIEIFLKSNVDLMLKNIRASLKFVKMFFSCIHLDSSFNKSMETQIWLMEFNVALRWALGLNVQLDAFSFSLCIKIDENLIPLFSWPTLLWLFLPTHMRTKVNLINCRPIAPLISLMNWIVGSELNQYTCQRYAAEHESPLSGSRLCWIVSFFYQSL